VIRQVEADATRTYWLLGRSRIHYEQEVSDRWETPKCCSSRVLVRSSDGSVSRRLYNQILGIGFKEEDGDYLHTETLEGAKTFALWPLSQAAQSCFDNGSWPDELPAPQAWLEFDVDNVEPATRELESQGYRMLVKNKTEPWGRTVSRFITPEGLLVGITFTPSMRGQK